MLLRETVPARVASDHVRPDRIYGLLRSTSIRGAAQASGNLYLDVDVDADLVADLVADAVAVLDPLALQTRRVQDRDSDSDWV
jgi:hypothetical protein